MTAGAKVAELVIRASEILKSLQPNKSSSKFRINKREIRKQKILNLTLIPKGPLKVRVMITFLAPTARASLQPSTMSLYSMINNASRRR